MSVTLFYECVLKIKCIFVNKLKKNSKSLIDGLSAIQLKWGASQEPGTIHSGYLSIAGDASNSLVFNKANYNQLREVHQVIFFLI